ncbi:MAG: class I SAM-dependent methyltransferase [Endomicrobiaceae bacterium]|nr:class I SAM-dependent methyltransferase [Endomicrobiaceae bacterium]MDD5101650.1 class I SAM-dependent methyltransferase [Endomicrobiaceae bacterium]
MDNVKEHFENEAEIFDNIIIKIIPYYIEMIDALLSAISFDKTQKINVLDLGCGTGNLSKRILDKYTNANIVCVDISQNMINIARQKLADYKNVEFVVGDIEEIEFKDKYDLVVSSLVLHHLVTDDRKKNFYKRIFNMLNENGIFVNADVVIGTSKFLQDINISSWIKYMQKSCSDEEIFSKWLKAYEQEDRPSKLIHQIEWLKEIGFHNVDIIWKYYNFAVFTGIKK